MLIGTIPNLTYKPKAGFSDNDSFTFKANDGAADSNTAEITIDVEEIEPEPPKLTGDVNGDETINIFDLVISTGSFGKTGAGIMGDVNADGSVNIFDLVTVASNFGKSLVAQHLP